MSPADGIDRGPASSSRKLRRAIRRLRWGRRVALWSAPAGPTRLGQLDAALARLPRRYHVVRIPYGAMPAAEICTLALAALDRSVAGDPERALLEAVAARRSRRERVVLAIDEADHLPLVEASRLRELTRRAKGSLRLLVVSSEGPEEDRLRGAMEDRPGAPLPRGRLPMPGSSGVLGTLRATSAPAPRAPAEARRPAADAARRRAPRRFTHRAADRALEAMARRLREDHPLVALVGPPGLGKTVVMRRLAAELADAFDPVWVPGMAFPAEELLRWMHYCRTGAAAPADPREAWRREVTHAQARGRPLLVLLDDAGSLGRDAVAALAEEIAWSEGRLRIALSLCDGEGREGEGVDRLALERVRLDAPLSPAESVDFLRTELGTPLDSALLKRVVEEARGVPAALLRGTSGWLARRTPLLRPAAPPARG